MRLKKNALPKTYSSWDTTEEKIGEWKWRHKNHPKWNTERKKSWGERKSLTREDIQMVNKHEKTLHIIFHQENANENSNEIPLHTYWNGQNPEHWHSKWWWECGAIEALTHCGECKMVKPLWKFLTILIIL